MTTVNEIDKEIDKENDNSLPSKCLAVFNLSFDTYENDLHEFFIRYGKISEVKVVKHRESGISKGYGFVDFQNLDDAEIAKEKENGSALKGNIIRIDYSFTTRLSSAAPGVYKSFKTYRNRKSRNSFDRKSLRDRSDPEKEWRFRPREESTNYNRFPHRRTQVDSQVESYYIPRGSYYDRDNSYYDYYSSDSADQNDLPEKTLMYPLESKRRSRYRDFNERRFHYEYNDSESLHYTGYHRKRIQIDSRVDSLYMSRENSYDRHDSRYDYNGYDSSDYADFPRRTQIYPRETRNARRSYYYRRRSYSESNPSRY